MAAPLSSLRFTFAPAIYTATIGTTVVRNAFAPDPLRKAILIINCSLGAGLAWYPNSLQLTPIVNGAGFQIGPGVVVSAFVDLAFQDGMDMIASQPNTPVELWSF